MRTRKLVIIALALLIITPLSSLKAQIIKGEVFLGGNACQVDGDECFGYKKFGVHAGVGALIPITNFMDVGFELLYSQKGAHKRDSIYYNSSLTGSYKLNLNYAEIPVMIYLTDKDKYSIGLGVSYGRIVGINEFLNGQNTGVGIGPGTISWKEGYSGPDLSKIRTPVELMDAVYSVYPNGDIVNMVENSHSYKGNDWSFCADLRIRLYEGLHAELRYQYSLVPIRRRIFYTDQSGIISIHPEHPYRLQYNNDLTLRIVYIFHEQRSKSNKAEQKAGNRY